MALTSSRRQDTPLEMMPCNRLKVERRLAASHSMRETTTKEIKSPLNRSDSAFMRKRDSSRSLDTESADDQPHWNDPSQFADLPESPPSPDTTTLLRTNSDVLPDLPVLKDECYSADADHILDLTPEAFEAVKVERLAAKAAKDAALLADRQAREALSAPDKLARRSPQAAWVYLPTSVMRSFTNRAYALIQQCIYDFGQNHFPEKYLTTWDCESDVRIEYHELKLLFGEYGIHTKDMSASAKHAFVDVIDALVGLRNSWAHPGATGTPEPSDPKYLDSHLRAVEELATLIHDESTVSRARELRIEVQRLAEKTFDEIEALVTYSKDFESDVQWEMHHQRLFDYAIHCKESIDATKVWGKMPHVLQEAADDWNRRYLGTVIPCRRQ